jgi:hypothetical protein
MARIRRTQASVAARLGWVVKAVVEESEADCVANSALVKISRVEIGKKGWIVEKKARLNVSSMFVRIGRLGVWLLISSRFGGAGVAEWLLR